MSNQDRYIQEYKQSIAKAKENIAIRLIAKAKKLVAQSFKGNCNE
jgi:hypothetical protein